jgi:multidrug efflux pump subunit AcrB
MGKILVQICLLVARLVWILATTLLPPLGSVLIGLDDNPWTAFGLGVPFVLLVFFTRKELRFIVTMSAGFQVAGGLLSSDFRLVAAAAFLIACNWTIWFFRGRFGETLPDGDNRPTVVPGSPR